MATRGRFITPRTAGFNRHIMEEHMRQRGQSVIIYQLDAEKTDKNDKNSIYRESSHKKFKDGVQLLATVTLTEKQYENLEGYGHELRNECDVVFNIYELKEKGIFPSIGDVISFQELFYEIYDTDDSSMLHGSPEYKFEFKVNSHDIRINDYDIPLDNDLQV